MPKRLFIALELPATVTAALGRLDPRLPGLRWLPARPLHLTLAFLGQVENDAVAPLIGALAAVSAPPFPLGLKGLGRFGRRGHPVVVWAGVEKPPPELFTLHDRILEAVRATGLEPDEKPLRPHVTVGRGKNVPFRPLRALLAAHAGTRFGRFDVTGFTLFSSALTPEGAVYARDAREFHRDFREDQSSADARCREI
jgi:2'-5' RNA ligase